MPKTSERLTTLLADLRSATAAKKCHRCACYRGTVEQLHNVMPSLPAEATRELLPVVTEGLSRLVPSEYDCLGCAVCWPANVLNLAVEEFPEAPIEADSACPTDIPERRAGWPPYPGNFRVLDAAGDVAVCVLTSEHLVGPIATAAPARVAIVGAVYTENLGIERILTNVLANPNLTTLLLCGADSQQRIGHLPGQSLLSLVANGLDERGFIIGAPGRRPVIKNVSREAVETFRRDISVIDRIGTEDLPGILASVAAMPASRTRRPAEAAGIGPTPIQAEPPARLVLDPKGYFVVLPDRVREVLVLEHYENDGVLSLVVEGARADEVVATVIARGIVSRLDHAAYLGKELALAERSLTTGEPYVQDRAPEPECGNGCGCHTNRVTLGGTKS